MDRSEIQGSSRPNTQSVTRNRNMPKTMGSCRFRADTSSTPLSASSTRDLLNQRSMAGYWGVRMEARMS